MCLGFKNKCPANVNHLRNIHVVLVLLMCYETVSLKQLSEFKQQTTETYSKTGLIKEMTFLKDLFVTGGGGGGLPKVNFKKS